METGQNRDLSRIEREIAAKIVEHREEGWKVAVVPTPEKGWLMGGYVSYNTSGLIAECRLYERQSFYVLGKFRARSGSARRLYPLLMRIRVRK